MLPCNMLQLVLRPNYSVGCLYESYLTPTVTSYRAGINIQGGLAYDAV
jgi:hypothetical protein